MRRHHALFVRLRYRRDDYLRFVTDPTVPFEINPAEVRQTLRAQLAGTGTGTGVDVSELVPRRRWRAIRKWRAGTRTPSTSTTTSTR
ncbi:hypothetical protein [Actinoplanes sp. NBRC 103695]|uniref:hypothetical protein n=1 Tax=Actinoplanes sp. NBRC 103695 TaxID=3032202 RepID=UPI0024A09D7B|nr:hypothetical protein [Actinoplanes sp. NBRC 103695]GLZ01772.1 hypothetical protein Acsp02_90230 [Actinoplanes sp. NBRC 103695]